MMHKVVFDTDIATDVDDVLALAVLLGSPEVELLGVTTVHADVTTRARFVEKLLGLRGVSKVPVAIGAEFALLGREAPYWEGHEGRQLLDGSEPAPTVDPRGAVSFLIDTIMASPGEITVLAVGPLTNVALAMLQVPRFAESIGRLVIMGGSIDTGYVGVVAEHNIKLDPEAAAIVFASKARIELIPLDVTLKVIIDASGVAGIRSGATPYHEAIATQIESYPPFGPRGQQTFLHDPLAALAVIDPSVMTWKTMDVQVELAGTMTRGMTVARGDEGAAGRVALLVDAERARDEIVARIAR